LVKTTFLNLTQTYEKLVWVNSSTNTFVTNNNANNLFDQLLSNKFNY